MIEKHCMLYPPSQESHITKDHVGGSEKLLLGTLLGGLTVLSVQPCASAPRLFGGTKWTRAGAATTQSSHGSSSLGQSGVASSLWKIMAKN